MCGFTPAATAPPSPVPAGVWRTVERENDLAPDEADPLFYWRMRSLYGFTGGEKRLKTFREGLRLRRSATATNDG